MSQERYNIAVFIDFDNIEIGVKTTLGEHFDVGLVLEALKERGEVVTKIAYADWTRAGEYSRALTQHAIRLVQRNLTPGGDKNGADINLALDALEMAFTHTHINAYVIVGGDSDFLSLVEKLKQYNKKVFVIGGRAFTSSILQRNCHEFIAYENLIRKPTVRGGRSSAPLASSPIAQAFPLVRRAIKILSDREVSPQTGLLKSTLLQLDSTFSERSYGASSFLDFAEKLAQAGFVQLKHAGRSVMVELMPDFADETDGASLKPLAEGEIDGPAPDDVPAFKPAGEQPFRPSGDQALRPATEGSGRPPANEGAQPSRAAGTEEMPTRVGDNAEGVRVAGEHVAAATSARWPMYLRNVKQILRAAGFDERRYGFTGLMELLKACQREGLMRIERDRRGGLRIFQGPAIARGNVAPPPSVMLPVADRETIEIDTIAIDDVEGEVIEVQPVTVVDTTAELLGRAKPRKPRARAGAAASPVETADSSRGNRSGGGHRKTVVKKAAPRRTRVTPKKVSDADGNK